jgi:hypothetical protein
VALLDDDRLVCLRLPAAHQLAGKWPRGAASGRVLTDSHRPIEEARVRNRLGLERVQTVEVAARSADATQRCGKPGHVRRGSRDRFTISHRHQEVRGAGEPDLGRLWTEVLRREAERRRKVFSIFDLRSEIRPGLPQANVRHPSVLAYHQDGKQLATDLLR